jgi:hypothetical protein
MNIWSFFSLRLSLIVIATLSVSAYAQLPSLTIEEFDTRVRIQYDGVHNLQTAPDVAGPWSSLGAQAGPVVDDFSEFLTRRFYRLNDSGVFSPNVVGYYRLDTCTGFAMVANQFNVAGGNTITNIFKAPPDNFQVFKYNPSTGIFTYLVYVNGIGWDGNHLDSTLNPGEGIFIYVGAAYTPRLLGEVPNPPSSVSIPAGWSIVSCPIPKSGRVDTLNFSPVDGDQIYRWDCNSMVYHYDEYVGGLGWSGSSGGLAPNIKLGEAFFIFNPAGARTWTPTF